MLLSLLIQPLFVYNNAITKENCTQNALIKCTFLACFINIFIEPLNFVIIFLRVNSLFNYYPKSYSMSVYCTCASLLFLIRLGIHSNAQQLHTSLDTSVFLEAVQMPAASTTYNLGFTAEALETVYVPIVPNSSAAQSKQGNAAVFCRH